jgi:hypothetical protein
LRSSSWGGEEKRGEDDHATWQITRLTVDGETLPDQPPVKLKRVKDDQP